MSDTHEDETVTDDLGGDLPERVPCSDEMCTGIFHADGTCGVCGKQVVPGPRETVAEALARLAAGATDVATAEGDAPAVTRPADDVVERDRDVASESREGDEGDERVPCVDDACTGVLDASGRCGTCGRLGADVVP